MCYTGLAFKEIESLRVVNLSRNIKGGFGLIITRQKTHKNIPEIPLLPQALELLEIYKDHPTRIREKKLFPIPSNQNFNSYLKEIATLAKIEKSITTHIGRKTFATTVALRNGMSMEVLSKMHMPELKIYKNGLIGPWIKQIGLTQQFLKLIHC